MALLLELINAKLNPPKETTPSFAGRNIIVTGANTGLGYEAALKFAALGANRVIIGVRSLAKGDAAKARIEAATGRGKAVEVFHLDMLDYTSIRAFVDRVNREVDHLDIAVLNAGVTMASYQKSQYGWEKTLQINVISTTLLALLLLPKLRASRTADFTPKLQIVGSSIQYSIKELKPDTETSGKAGPLEVYNRGDDKTGGVAFTFDQYGTSKVLLEYAHKEIASLATSSTTGKPDVIVSTVCPGPTKSDLARDTQGFLLQIFIWVFQFLSRTTEQGARSYISGVTLGEEVQGRLWNNDKIREPAPLLIGEKGQQLQKQVWGEVIDALEVDVPEVVKLAKA